MPDGLKVYVGYDTREDIAWQVCRFSLQRHASKQVDIFPLKQDVLRDLGLYSRAVDTTAATEFSLTRFLTPYLADYDGWSMFVDCDFLFTTDILSVVAGLAQSKAIYVVKHDYTPINAVKMDGKAQSVYPRKNWSSFILFNGRHPDVKMLTPRIVNRETPAYLHRFSWVSNDDDIGELPITWNFLEGEYARPEQTPSAIHFTNGGPWFENWQKVEFADLWLAEKDRYRSTLEEQAASG